MKTKHFTSLDKNDQENKVLTLNKPPAPQKKKHDTNHINMHNKDLQNLTLLLENTLKCLNKHLADHADF